MPDPIMNDTEIRRAVKLTLVIPCYNEERTLEACVKNVLEIEDDALSLAVSYTHLTLPTILLV